MEPGITVTGSAEVRAIPDVLFVTLGVEHTAPRASEARARATEAMAQLLGVLRGAGVQTRDIQTASVTLQPIYDYNSSEGRTLRGYTAAQSLAVILRDLERSGEVIDAALEAAGDAARMNGLRFGFSNPAGLLTQARREAIADARSRAETYAAAAGVAVGAVLSIVEATEPPSRPVPRGMLEAKAMSTPIEAGEEGVTASVVIQFAVASGAKPKKRG